MSNLTTIYKNLLETIGTVRILKNLDSRVDIFKQFVSKLHGYKNRHRFKIKPELVVFIGFWSKVLFFAVVHRSIDF